MKALHLFSAILAIAACGIIYSCSPSDKEGPGKEYLDYLKSEDYKKDLNNLTYAATLNKCVKLSAAKAFSNNFTLRKGQESDFNQKKVEYWSEFLSFLNAIEEHREDFEASMKRLEEHKVFSTATPNKQAKDKNAVSLLPIQSNGGVHQDPFSFLASPAYAAPIEPEVIIQPLMVQEMAEFFGIATELSQESRKMTIACASNLSNNDLKEIYNRLPEDIRGGTSDYKTWWNNLEKGKYDVKGHKIFHTIIDDQTHPSNLNFMDQAENMGLLDPGEFVKKAKRVIAAGAKLELDLTNKVLGSVMPGYGDVYDKVEIAVSTTNLGGKIVTGEVTMDDALDYCALTEKTIIGEAIKGTCINVPGVGTVELGTTPFNDAGEIQGSVGLFLDKANKGIEKLLGNNPNPKLDWEDEPEPATISASDKDKDTPAEKIIVEDKNTGEIFIGIATDKDGNTFVTVPGNGDYNITTVDKNGDKWTIVNKHVNNGENVELEGDTEEEELWEELLENPEEFEDTAEEEQQQDVEEKTEENKSDDADVEDNAKFIVGNWKTTKVEKLIDSDEDDWVEFGDEEDMALARSIKLHVREDGTCTLISSDDNVSCRYTFDGMTLALKHDGENVICPVNKLGKNKIRLTYSEKGFIVILIMEK